MTGFQLHNPSALWLLALAAPFVYLSLTRMRETERVRRWTILGVRIVLLLLLIALLADIRRIKRNDDLTVIGLIDTSGSVRQFADLPVNPEEGVRDNLDYLRQWLRHATRNKRADDRVGLIVFNGRPIALATPTTAKYDDSGIDRSGTEGTNIAEAIRYGLAMFPPDTARRLVLLTDGNETAGDAVDAAHEAAGAGIVAASAQAGAGVTRGAVPIDVVPIRYDVENEVLLERIEVPTYGRPDQRITVRIVLRSAAPVTGRVHLQLEDRPIDLNGPDEEGSSRIVTLQPGLNVVTTEVTLGEAAVNRFQASFEPLELKDDRMRGNNSAEAFTITPQRGSVLIADGVYDNKGKLLADVLSDAGFFVRRVPPTGIPTSLVELQSYDAVILQNVPAEDVNEDVQEHLVRYVNDLGGGLMMVGGYDSFGAGSWDKTPLASILPVSMEVPEEMRVPTAAVALVLDRSGSMNFSVTGTRRIKQEIANEGAALAILSLDRNDYITVIAFASSSDTVIPLQRVNDADKLAREVRNIRAGGGTNLLPAMRRAFTSLQSVDAEIKHVVCLSDGQSQGQGFAELAAQMNNAGITVSTIAVGDDADTRTLEDIATRGGGRYYFVRNPEILPRIFVKDIRIIRRPLIREKKFTPLMMPTGSPVVNGIDPNLPPLYGLVLTQPIEGDPTVNLLMTAPEGEPIMAYRQSGLGRTGAFTSDAYDNWARDWIHWDDFRPLWVQFLRTISRPPGNRDFDLRTTFEDDQLVIRLTEDPTEEDAPPRDESAPGDVATRLPLNVPGFVYTPDGKAVPVQLRPTGPAMYEQRIAAPEGGNYVVALTPQRGRKKLGLVLGGVSRPVGIEYRRLRSDADRMIPVARTTGGRLLQLDNPDAVDLFDRSDLPETVSVLPIWPALLWWALAMLIADVAVRRIAWDGEMIARRIRATMNAVRRAPQRAEEAAGTLQRLRTRERPPTRTPATLPERTNTSSQEAPLSRGAAGRAGGVRADQSPERLSTTLSRLQEKVEPKPQLSEEEKREARRLALAALKGRGARKTDQDQKSDAPPASAEERASTPRPEAPANEPDTDDDAQSSSTGDDASESMASRLLARRRRSREDKGADSDDRRDSP